MEEVRLETADGHYVTTGIMPAFNEWPAVVLWGTRVFQLQTKGKTGEPTTYSEVFCVAIVQTKGGCGFVG